ncbi:MAG: hypothetical protein ACD_77C00407G0005 [uncultured bacterium]|nr:MAG: hypothetical protein ACD_77C00407G0005 [uncultured bacterium]HBY01385.1 hypothetical protein [Rikenellaceae bacterium]
MGNISSVGELKESIRQLEMEQAIKGELLKEQFFTTYDSFSLISLLRNSFKKTASSPDLINDVLGTALGLATGFISKKIFIGSSGNVFRKIFGSALQLGVISFVSQHSREVKLLGHFLIQQIFSKRR